MTLSMQKIDEFCSSSEKRDPVRVLADTGTPIWQSNSFLKLHDSNAAFQEYSKAAQWHKRG